MSINLSISAKNGVSIAFLFICFILLSGFRTGELIENKAKVQRKKVVKTAQKYLGSKYRSGGKSPKGFDCSGFSYFVMKENKIQLGRSSRDQALQGERTKIKNLKPGDLIFFGTSKRINHVGIITRNDRKSLVMIHASSSRGIVEEDINQSDYWKKRIQMGRSVIQ